MTPPGSAAPPGSWEQPGRTSGWARTSRDWLLGSVPPLVAAGAVLLFAPVSVPTLVAAGLVGAGGTVGLGLLRRRNVWQGYRPPARVDYRPRDPELPSLLHANDLAVEGCEIENSVRGLVGGSGLYFQAVDRLGGRRDLVLLDLAGIGVTVSMGRARNRFTSRTPIALGIDLNGYDFVREPNALPTEQLYVFATERLGRVLSTCTLSGWRMHGRYLTGRLRISSKVDPLAAVVRAADDLSRIRRAIPERYITALPEAERPGEDGDWPLFRPA